MRFAYLIVLVLAIFIVLTIFTGGWQSLVRRLFPFVCPDCSKRYRRYYQGCDCRCGKINLCLECFTDNHIEHHDKTVCTSCKTDVRHIGENLIFRCGCGESDLCKSCYIDNHIDHDARSVILDGAD